MLNQNDGVLEENSGFTVKDIFQRKFAYLGGIGCLVPYFYVVRFLPESAEITQAINLSFELLVYVLRHHKDSQQEAVREQLFSVLALLMNECGVEHFDLHTIEILATIRETLSEKRLKEDVKSVDRIIALSRDKGRG